MSSPGSGDRGSSGEQPLPRDGEVARYRQRHRKRRRPQILVPSWRWWQLLLALVVALVAGGLTILLVRGASEP
jgi:hypothetical protein